MFLKRIEIQGFKSFADKTQIEFQSGITGVVGPNGSGKSNISDSIRWVLGEQSVKSLRGNKMEDVVFAGTEKRKPLGFAEVTLVLDNKDKALPIEYAEVSVTRRVFRSGESEYYINKNSCRLKDIKELFMDTGVGKDGYSIVGQGKIDEILSSKSEDRRNIFEEAAGIVKYKSRKEEAEKKLDKTEDNLLRVNDIVEELRKQINPLKIQAEKAIKYNEMSEELKKIQISLYIDEIAQIKEELKKIEDIKEISLESLRKNGDLKKDLDTKYESIKEQIEQIDLEIDQLKNDRYNTKNDIEKKNSEKDLINEKITYSEKEIERHNNEIVNLKEHIVNSQLEEKELSKKKNDLSEVLEVLTSEVNVKDYEFQKIKEEMDKKEKNIEDKKSSVIENFNLIADKKSKINSLNSFKENIRKRLKQINEEIAELKDSREKIKSSTSDLEKKIKDDKEILENINKELRDIVSSKKNNILKLQEIDSKIGNIERNIQGKISKHKVLDDMSKEYEGYYKGVKNALKACQDNRQLGQGVKGVLAELISSPKKYEKATEIALGAAIQNIVVDTQENAKVIINHLKKNNLGRVTFLPMSSISSRQLNVSEKKLLRDNGVIGVGSELLDYDLEYRNIVEYLLGRVLLVEKIEDGIAVSKKCNYSLKIVSLDGDVLNPGGSMTGGSLNNFNTKLLGRQREIEELESEIRELKKEYKSLVAEREVLKNNTDELDTKISQSNDIINNTKLLLATNESKYIQICTDEERNKSLISKFLSEQKNLTDETINIERETERIDIELNKLNNQNSDIQSNIESYISDFEIEKSKRESMSKEITELKIKKASLEQEDKNIIDTIERLKQEILKSSDSISNKEKEQQQVAVNIENLKKSIKINTDEKEELDKVLMNYETKLEKANGERENLLKTIIVEEEKIRSVNHEIEGLKKTIVDLELKFERYNLQYENYNNKLWEEYELSFQMAQKYKQDIDDITKTKEQVKDIKNKIKALGNINLNSIEEYKNVSERYEFMTSQIDDLITAKDSLDDVIKEMNVKMKEQFIEQFEVIRAHFKDVFKELFGGGKSDVYLSDKEDVLLSGIEIVAQPPGKKLQNLTLLSGGERALTAIALLFAIIKTKPTPFCVLDEIEAALDEANVYRYAEYLKEFSHSTQFIAITHRKGTMENVDSLYGITMEEEGISKLVSIKLSEKEKEKVS